MAPRFVQRLLPAAGVTLAVAALGFGVIGFAAADTGQDGLPERFQLVRPHGGDRGVYQVVEDSMTEEGMEHVEGEDRFLWLDEQPFLDGRDGTWHAAHGRLLDSHATVEFSEGEPLNLWWITWIDSGTGLAIGDTAWTAMTGFSVGSGVPEVLPIHATQATTSTRTGTVWTDPQECSLASQLAIGVRLDGPIRLPDHCAEAGESVETYTASRSTVGGVPTIRFETTRVEDDSAEWFAADYAEGVPEPLREQWTTSIGGRLDWDFVSTLTAFEAGAGAWDTGLALPPRLDLPEVTLAARDPWGPSEDGVQHPFPASQAWATARDDPASTSFGEYLAAHPDALAATAEYLEEREGNQTHRTWLFLVKPDRSGGEGGYFLSVTQSTGPAGAAATDMLGLPLQAPTVTTYDFAGFSSSSLGSPEPLPDVLPTVASVMARWQAHLGIDEPANGWSFDVDEVSAGQVGVELPAPHLQDVPTGSQRAANATYLHLSVGADGVPVALVEETRAARRAHGGLDAVAPGGVAPREEAPASRLAFATIAWALPTGPVASGAVAVSLLAGLAYWLWPLVKDGGSGLFSRIQAPHLLDHPRRVLILDAIAAEPGIHFSELLRRTGMGNGSLHHHLKTLRDAGRVEARAAQGYTCYFPAGAQSGARGAAAAKADGAQRILGHVRSHPGRSVKQVAAECGLHPSTVTYHVQRLCEAGLVDALRDGREVRLHSRVTA
ncbi:MAG TPA: winged helix-turn-helix transcriptional regulator [Candidatus Thermoplasmatota archaeon]|nr:winged helix-turn-helix transcriptional regulator [Candidatus Thermoplasmatota archaeon]